MAEGGVDVDDVARRVGDDDAFVGVGEDARGEFQLGFSGLVLGDVGKGKDAANDFPAQPGRARFAFDEAAIGELQQVAGFILAVRVDGKEPLPVGLGVAHAGFDALEYGRIVARFQRLARDAPDFSELAVHAGDMPILVEQQEARSGGFERGAKMRHGVGERGFAGNGADDEKFRMRRGAKSAPGNRQRPAVGAPVAGFDAPGVAKEAERNILADNVGDRFADELVLRIAKMARRGAVGRAYPERRQIDKDQDLIAVFDQKPVVVVGSHKLSLRVTQFSSRFSFTGKRFFVIITKFSARPLAGAHINHRDGRLAHFSFVDMDLAVLIEETVTGLGFELVDIEQSPRGRLLRVFIDKPEKAGGVDVEDCAFISNHLSRVLAVENVDYDRLEISSPGLDRVLKKPADFARFTGSEITLRLKLPRGGRRNFNGILRGLRGGRLHLGTDSGEIELDLCNVDKARLVPGFDR